MPRRVDYRTQVDFTGGLNLSRNSAHLEETETPDCLNMDMDPRGGFTLRKGVDPYLTALPGVSHSVLPYVTSTGIARVLVGVGTGLYGHDGTSWVPIWTGGPGGPYRSVTFKDRIYVVSGNSAVRRWDGTSSVTLTDPAVAGWNDNIASPTPVASTGDFPKAKVVAAFNGSVFAANIVEGSTSFPCRVRWSHPLFPEDWFSYQYVDIEPEDGDEITALVPLGDRLIVFKRNSIHAIYGTPPESISVAPISRELGAPSQEAVAGSDLGVMFWHESSGAHMLNPDAELKWLGERLYAVIEDGRISAGRLGEACVGWLNRRLWVSVPFEGSTVRNHVFVYDPFASKKGAWTQYDLSVGPFLNFTPPGSVALPLAAHSTASQVLELEVFDKPTDDIGAGETHIAAHYVTRWWDNGAQVVKKRWKRPEVLLLGGQETEIVVDVFRDWDLSAVRKTFKLQTTLDGEEAVWDQSDWDEAAWADEGGDRGELERGSPLGNAKAVALRFTGPTTDSRWRVDALTMKWISRRVRN